MDMDNDNHHYQAYKRVKVVFKFKKISNILDIYIQYLKAEKGGSDDLFVAHLNRINRNIVTAIKRKKMSQRINEQLKKTIKDCRKEKEIP